MVNRIWRIVATGLCFAVFGLGGLVLRCLVCPLLTMMVRDLARQQKIAQAIIHHSFRWFVTLMKTMGVISYEVRGMALLQRRGLLILANHPSLIDVVFLISFIRHANCIVKAALVKNPFMRSPIKAAGFITNEDGVGLLEQCLKSLAGGNNLIIFPEGTRTPLHGRVKLQRGAAHVAVRGRIDITPVHIHSSLPMLTKGSQWWKVPARKPHFTIDVRADIEVEDFFASAASESLAVRDVTEYLSEQLFKRPDCAST